MTKSIEDNIYRIAPPPIPKGLPGYIPPGRWTTSSHQWAEDRLPEAESSAAKRP